MEEIMALMAAIHNKESPTSNAHIKSLLDELV